MFSNLRFATRQLVKAPGFTIIALVTLALGIGLNTAMFSLINVYLLQPLKFPDSQNLYFVQRATPQQHGSHSPAAVEEIKHGSADFAQLAVDRHWGFTLSEPNHPAERVHSLRVSSNYFNVLGVKPELGRNFLPEEDQTGRNNVVILSKAYWQSRFGGDPSVIGRTIRLDGALVQVVGVLPASAAAPTIFGPVRLFRPLGLTTDEKTNWTDNAYDLVGRYRPDVTATQTKARFTALGNRLAADHPKETAGSWLETVSMQSTGLGANGKNITFMLLGLSGFVLLIACANLANLLLARAVSRAREFAIRAALGASRAQLIKPLVMECTLLSIGGGALAILVSTWTSDWMANRLSNDGASLDFSPDWRVLAFAFGVSLATGLLFGVAPAWLVSRVRVNDTLKSGTRGSTGDRSQHRFRQVLIVVQFALALVLLTGAAFFVRGVERLVHSPAGWNPTLLLRADIYLPPVIYSTADRTMAFYTQLEQRIGALPGVTGVAISYAIPMFGFGSQRSYAVEGQPAPIAGHEPVAMVNGITAGYFNTLGTRLLSGRPFAETDQLHSPHVVIINEAMAHALFPHGDAVGKRLSPIGEKTPGSLEIVGVVENVRFLNLSPSPVRFQLYLPLTQETWNYVAVTVRTSGVVESLMEPFRQTIAGMDPEMPALGLLPVSTSIERNTDDLKLFDQLLIGFAILGLFLAALGIYSVVARLVVQRTNEIGIRMALGAQMRDVVRLILSAGLRMVFVGTGLGLLGSFALARFLANAMPALAAGNIPVFAGASAGLVVIALLACWLPARRATKIDPLVALRAE
ncbi:MAG: ABC transporter permease [Lacunisphaera sp.]